MTWWLAAIIVVILALGLYASFTARRLDRLHIRVDLAALALDEQLSARATSAGSLAAIPTIRDQPSAQLVARAAATVEQQAPIVHLTQDREVAENALGAAIAALLESGAADGELLGVTDLVDQATRAAFARRFYNDAVRDALSVRDARVVRWLHLAGRASHPAYLELDDAVIPTVPVVP